MRRREHGQAGAGLGDAEQRPGQRVASSGQAEAGRHHRLGGGQRTDQLLGAAHDEHEGHEVERAGERAHRLAGLDGTAAQAIDAAAGDQDAVDAGLPCRLVSTRRLILAALLCGLAIVVAFALQLILVL